MTDVIDPKNLKYVPKEIPKWKYHKMIDAYEGKEEKSETVKKSNRGRKPVVVKNKVLPYFLTHPRSHFSGEILNIIEGVCQLNWYSKKNSIRTSSPSVLPFPSAPCMIYGIHPLDRSSVYNATVIRSGGMKGMKQSFPVSPYYNATVIQTLVPAGETRVRYLDELTKKTEVDSLSTKSMMSIFKHLEEINSSNIQKLLDLGSRQAERYLKAVKVIMPDLEQAVIRAFERKEMLRRETWQRLCDKDKEDFLKKGEPIVHKEEDVDDFLQSAFDLDIIHSIGGGLSPHYHEGINGVWDDGIDLDVFASPLNVMNLMEVGQS